MPFIIIGLGSNKPFNHMLPHEIVAKAATVLGALGTPVKCSPLYRSDAWPDPTLPHFVNAVATLTSPLDPLAMLRAMQAIEAGFGRVREEDPAQRYTPRTLDLDLLDYGGVVIDTPALTLPHSAMTERGFVMRPLCDLVLDWSHPVAGNTCAEILSRLDEPGTRRLEIA